MVTSQCVSFAFGDLPTFNSQGTNLPRVKNKSLREEFSFRFYLPLKKEHGAKNKILGELNILSLSISES